MLVPFQILQIKHKLRLTLVITTFIISKNGDKINAAPPCQQCQSIVLRHNYMLQTMDYMLFFSYVTDTRFHTFDFFFRGILLNIRSLLIDFNINYYILLIANIIYYSADRFLEGAVHWCAIGSTRRVRGDRDLQSWRTVFSNTVQPRC